MINLKGKNNMADIDRGPNPLKGNPCTAETCTDIIVHKTYCIRHYKQVKRHGHTFITTYEKRPAIIGGDIARIPLGIDAKDGYAIVDKEFAWVDKYNWHLAHGYVMSHNRTERRRLHTLVTSCPKELEVDHEDSNPLNNRLSNLRVCTHADNMKNVKLPSDNTSGYKGVCWDKAKGKWMVRLGSKFMGYFGDITEAAKTYNKRAKETYGEFAHLNEIGETK